MHYAYGIVFTFLLVLFLTACMPDTISIEGAVYEDRNETHEYDTTNTSTNILTNDALLSDVFIESGNVYTITDADGEFSIVAGVYDEGMITLYLSKDGYEPRAYNITIAEGDENPMAVEKPGSSNALGFVYIPMERKE